MFSAAEVAKLQEAQRLYREVVEQAASRLMQSGQLPTAEPPETAKRRDNRRDATEEDLPLIRQKVLKYLLDYPGTHRCTAINRWEDVTLGQTIRSDYPAWFADLQRRRVVELGGKRPQSWIRLLDERAARAELAALRMQLQPSIL